MERLRLITRSLKIKYLVIVRSTFGYGVPLTSCLYQLPLIFFGREVNTLVFLQLFIKCVSLHHLFHIHPFSSAKSPCSRYEDNLLWTATKLAEARLTQKCENTRLFPPLLLLIGSSVLLRDISVF